MLKKANNENGGLDFFLAAQDYAKVQLEEEDNEKDRSYWQGVKDGLRKCFAIFTNDSKWSVLCRAALLQRPGNAYDRWE